MLLPRVGAVWPAGPTQHRVPTGWTRSRVDPVPKALTAAGGGAASADDLQLVVCSRGDVFPPPQKGGWVFKQHHAYLTRTTAHSARLGFTIQLYAQHVGQTMLHGSSTCLDHLDLHLPYTFFRALDLPGTDLAQDTCPKACRLFGSHPEKRARSCRSYRSYRSYSLYRSYRSYRSYISYRSCRSGVYLVRGQISSDEMFVSPSCKEELRK